MSGDFNVDFAKGISKHLVDFWKTTLDLDRSNDPNESTTKYRTTIDAFFYFLFYFIFFFRYSGIFQSKVLISYFCYHKPIVSFIEYNTNDDESEENLPE